MKIAIVGAGAIGGWIGARLASLGADTSALARGATLEALRRHGWRLRSGGTELQAPVRASDRAEDLGPQDLVVIAVKGQSLPALAPRVAPLLGERTVVLPAMNGVPWWFLDAGPLAGRRLEAVDPGGAIAARIPISRVLGCVVHASCSSLEPGYVQHKFGEGLILGEPDRTMSERLDRVATLLSNAGFDVTRSENIQQAVWYKLWGNMTMNPISLLTRADCQAILDDPRVAAFVLQLMDEAREVGRRIGCDITETGEARNAVTRKLGAFKTSMLQDAEAGRELELDPLLAAPLEIARMVGVPTPGLDALFGLARVHARAAGLCAEV